MNLLRALWEGEAFSKGNEETRGTKDDAEVLDQFRARWDGRFGPAT